MSARKPGWKASEFWLSLGGFALGAFLVVWGAVQKDRELLLLGLGTAGLTTTGYTAARSFLKAKSKE